MYGGFLVPPWFTFPQAPVFIPDGGISPVRLATLATVPQRPFPDTPKLKRWPTYTPGATGLISDSVSLWAMGLWALCPSPFPSTTPTKRREPLRPVKVLPLEGWHSMPPRRALPLRPRSYWLMRQSQLLPKASLPLFPRVFAGCCQPLLEEGPSRPYLCTPCVGAWTHTSRCHLCARARFFQRCNGLAQGARSSAHRNTPAKQLPRGVHLRGCSHSLMFRPPHSLDPPAAPTAGNDTPWAAGPFTPRTPRLVTCPG
jgi:hypothetical protein